MAETLERRRWVIKSHSRQSARPDAEFVTILTFLLSGLALFLLAIAHGWLGIPNM
jgi:hypothetical protein